MTHDTTHISELQSLAKLIRYYSLRATTTAGSGHPTSALSATDLMTGLLFGGTFRFDLDNPGHPNNDRLIFSKGHASPLFYALWAATGKISEEELWSYRQFGSRMEGHPTPRFPYAEAATGSLGQGLGVAFGMALNAKYVDRLPYRTYVLLGDSEMSEGSQWEAIQLAAHYRLSNLVGVIDVNGLGQRGATMLGHDLQAYARRVEAFGWRTCVIDGHAMPEILDAFATAADAALGDQPVMIIAGTLKGKGVSFLENAEGWHGRALDEKQLDEALRELGTVDRGARGRIVVPENLRPSLAAAGSAPGVNYEIGQSVATRKACGAALKRIHEKFPQLVCLDAEVSNSTRTDLFQAEEPARFFEMFISEQTMVEAALGFSLRGKLPFVATFAAFLTRAFDQVRMSQYSDANIKFIGSHAGVSIGEDGPSQMGLEDIAMFRSVLGSTVLQPSDAVSAEKLVEAAAEHQGLVYLRTMRQDTPVLYENDEEFPIGGSKVLRQSNEDAVTILATGATVHEALTAHLRLHAGGIAARVIDVYSLKPIDELTLREAVKATKALVTVEDHYPAGGLGEAVLASLADNPPPTTILAVDKRPLSGTGSELREYSGISAESITEAATRMAKSKRRRRTLARK